jgi:hypothetical protein
MLNAARSSGQLEYYDKVKLILKESD